MAVAALGQTSWGRAAQSSALQDLGMTAGTIQLLSKIPLLHRSRESRGKGK